MRAVCCAPSGAGGRRRAYHSPAGGQGVNLGFMDAAELVAELKRCIVRGKTSGSTFICVAMSVPQAQCGADAGWYAGIPRSVFGTNPAKKLLRDIGLKLADTLLALNHNLSARQWD